MNIDVKENIAQLRKLIDEDHCKLVAVSKTKPVSVLMEAYETGIRHFGENKVQELTDKYEEMPKDIHWHMIGHLQRNKVKYIAPFVYLIHAVDSLRLLQEIEKQGHNVNRIIHCLLQIHIAEEESKFGLNEEEALALLHSEEVAQMQHVRIMGLMGMATFTDDKAQVRKEFQSLKNLFEKVKTDTTFPSLIKMQELSMGMSGDFSIALEEGSTMVRIGSTIFGLRNYN
jgi:PLP dependent protein